MPFPGPPLGSMPSTPLLCRTLHLPAETLCGTAGAGCLRARFGFRERTVQRTSADAVSACLNPLAVRLLRSETARHGFA